MSDNENEVLVQPVRTFCGEEGHKTPESDPFPVSRQRFADLKANGLVIDAAEAEQKAAPQPNNKSNPKPNNK